MKKAPKQLVIANVFGTLGYLSIIFQWFWSALILTYPLLSSRPDFLFLQQSSPAPATSFTPSPALTPLIVIASMIVTVALILATAIVLIQLPKRIGQKASTITHSAASRIIPQVVQQKKISKRARTQLSFRLVLLLKVVGILIPLATLIFEPEIAHMPSSVIWAMALFCAACSVVYFAVQYLIAKLTRVDTARIW